MKKAFAIIMLFTVLLLSACNSTGVPQNLSSGDEIGQNECSTTIADNETMMLEKVNESANNSSSQLVTEPSETIIYEKEEPVNQPDDEQSQPTAESSDSTEGETVTVTDPLQQQVADPGVESESTEETETESRPESTAPPEETPVESSPTEETTPEEETETEPEFDINYWIGYAKDYAVSKGLVLSSAAVDCWDNPIGAGAHCIYLERDIQSRLNRYANDEDITDVWIWAEPTGDDRYDLYIGYA